MKNIVLIFAGGVGKRMGSKTPKQFLEINGKPIIIQTTELFELNDDIDEIYIACVESHIELLNKLLKKFNIQKVVKVIPGGGSGQDTIYRGLKEIRKSNDEALVLIHDGVRPLVSEETITNCIKDCKKYGSSIAVKPAYETPINSTDGKTVGEMLDRDNIYTAQAPQCFFLNQILDFHEEERKSTRPYEGIVDSCGLAFRYGLKAHLTPGNRNNIKVTTIDDYLTLIANASAENYNKIFELAEEQKHNN